MLNNTDALEFNTIQKQSTQFTLNLVCCCISSQKLFGKGESPFQHIDYSSNSKINIYFVPDLLPVFSCNLFTVYSRKNA